MRPVSVLSIASEVYPLIKTGGLADVTGALPGALEDEEIRLTTLLPGYPAVVKALKGGKAVHTYADLFGGPARLLSGKSAGLPLLVLDAPHLYDRKGNPYVGPDGQDWPDNAQRFAALARCGADIGLGLTKLPVPDIVHAHDWQAALAPAYLHYADAPRPATVMTVHNLAFQGRFPAAMLEPLGFPPAAFAYDGIEYYGGIGFLKAGLQLCDRITTVSPTYALEILGAEAGMGLDGLLRARAGVLHGIINGIDTQVWNPASDPDIPAAYDLKRLKGRKTAKRELQQRLGLRADPDALVYGVVSRLSWQKGLDLLLDSLPAMLETGAQLALLGSGDPALERGFENAMSLWHGRVACQFGYDEALAHLIQAGSDALLVPSRFEPCGLTQLCALRYGSVPVVARVGGLADTVIDANEMALARGVATGVQFSPVDRPMLEAALRRTAGLWADKPVWSRMQKNGMSVDVSWTGPARRYAKLYRDLLAERA